MFLRWLWFVYKRLHLFMSVNTIYFSCTASALKSHRRKKKNKPKYKLKMNDEEKKVRLLQNSDRNQFGEYINFIIHFFSLPLAPVHFYHFHFSNIMKMKALNFYLLCNFSLVPIEFDFFLSYFTFSLIHTLLVSSL